MGGGGVRRGCGWEGVLVTGVVEGGRVGHRGGRVELRRCVALCAEEPNTAREWASRGVRDGIRHRARELEKNGKEWLAVALLAPSDIQRELLADFAQVFLDGLHSDKPGEGSQSVQVDWHEQSTPSHAAATTATPYSWLQ